DDCRRRGIKVMAMVSTVEAARTAAAGGADVIVAQGGEAGGHRSIEGKPASPDATTGGLLALRPEVVDVGLVPVVAAVGSRVVRVRDLPGAGEVVAAVLREARAVLSALPDRVRQA